MGHEVIKVCALARSDTGRGSRYDTIAVVMSRQTFLRGAVGAPATSAVFPTILARATPGDGWASLASSIGGQVLLPANGRSVHERKADLQFELQRLESGRGGDGRLAGRRPEGGFVAAASKLKIAVRGGGHSYIGASSANGAMVLDLLGLPGGVHFDSATRNVRCRPRPISMRSIKRWPVSRAIPTGSCPTVGVAGLTLGGGLGADSRHAGLTCDALKSATVVLPGGDAVSASADDHAELFWALRGGGAATSG